MSETQITPSDTSDDDNEEEGGLVDEIESIGSAAEEVQTRLKALANQAQEGGDVGSARAIREIAGNVLPLVADLATYLAIVASSALGEDDGGSRLDDDDAEELHGLLVACQKAVGELRGLAGDAEKPPLDTLLALIAQKIAWVRDVGNIEDADAVVARATAAAEASPANGTPANASS